MFEEPEDRFTVIPLLGTAWVFSKIVMGVGLEYEQATGRQEARRKNQVRNFRDIWQRIRRAGKNVSVRLPHRPFHELKNVHPENLDVFFNAEGLDGTLHELDRRAVFIHVRNVRTTTADELIIVGTRPAKEIKETLVFKVEPIIQDVKQPFLSVVRCGPGGPVVCRRGETAAFEFSRNDAHGR